MTRAYGTAPALGDGGYAAKLADMDDEAFLAEVEMKVWLSSFAANNPRSKYHAECDATYAEAVRREKPWLYQRGWNAAYASCGHTPTERDRIAARPPVAEPAP